jgi:hypothetical protein
MVCAAAGVILDHTFEFARQHLGVQRAAIVCEDNRNPAVAAVES